MKKALLSALCLPNVLYVTDVQDGDKNITVSCKTKKRTILCPHCKGRSSGYDTRVHKKLHTSLHGKKVFLHAALRRLECKECGKVFTEAVEGMSGIKTTAHFDQLVQEKSRNQDFASVARELNINPKTVAKKQDLLALEKFSVPDYEEVNLGLDGKYLNGDHEIFVMGDVKRKKFFGVTKDNSAANLKKVLKENLVDTGKKVVTVSMDMSKTLKSIKDSLFPKATLVIDKFHVFKYVNVVIDLCRVAIEKTNNERFNIKRLLLMKVKTLENIRFKPKWKKKVQRFEEILATHPEIRILWDLKNRLHVFYESADKEEAEERFEGIISYLDSYKKEHPEFAGLKKTLLNWKPYILNHFDTGITNAFIEGLNNRIETLKRKRYGFRDTNRFIRSIVFALLPIFFFIPSPIFTH
jgi:transposase